MTGNRIVGRENRSIPKFPILPVVRLIVALPLSLVLVATGLALEWQSDHGFRSAPLTVPAAGRPGFRLLPAGETGLVFTNHLSDAKAAENQIRLNGSGVALGDVDGDGWCDIYLCSLGGSNALYRNLGGWRFVDITAEAGVACPGQDSTGAVFADVDGDGDLDLLVNGIGVGTRLFLNMGGGRFRESTESGLARKLGATTLALADIDNDGDLDLYVTNYRTTTIRTTGFAVMNVNGRKMILPEDRDRLEYTPEGRVLEHGEVDILYRNEGKGRFRPVSWTDGTFLDEDGRPITKPPHDWGLAAMFRDLNDDHAPDLYVCNDFHSPDRIWLNDGQGHFRALPKLALRKTSTFSMAVDVADLNHDGLDEIFVADMLSLRRSRRLMQLAATDPYSAPIGVFDDRPQFDRNTLHLNRGDGTYAEIAHFAGLEASDWTWSAIFLDVDLDGYEDLLCSTGHAFDTQDLDAEARIRAQGPWPRERIPQKLLLFPKMQMSKVAFRNRGNLTFEEIGAVWGFNQVGVAHGMALADLDNDGDLDVVVNNLNQAVGVYRNESGAPRVAVRLKGLAPNTRGIGAKIWLYGGAVPMQSQEMICGGRYLSGDDAMRVFAAGGLTNEMRIEVHWRSGKRSVVSGVKANRIYEIDEAGARPITDHRSAITNFPLVFEDVSQLIKHVHHEDDFNDFERQPLLPKKLSQLGPGVSWTDVDGDGWEDLVVGSGKGGKLAVYRNDGKGGFSRMTNRVLESAVTRDQTGVLGMGLGAVLVGSANYEDGLASGGSVREYDLVKGTIDDALPGAEWSVGPLALGDVDGDGDLDLFVGGRVMGGRYPDAASSRVYRHAGGKWVLDEANSKLLAQVGLVSGAVWSDLDGDGLPELILACEWGPVRIFRNERGKLVPWDAPVTINLESFPGQLNIPSTLNQLTGWWNGVTTGDFDGDGRMDIAASNWGLNSEYQSAQELPMAVTGKPGGASANESSQPLLFYGDFDGNGTLDLIEARLDPALKKPAPVRSLNAVAGGLPLVSERFNSFAAYGQAGVEDLLGDQFKTAKTVRASWMASTVFLNRGDRFVVVPLPAEAQFASAFGITVADFDGDGNEDLFLSQNFFPVQPTSSRLDAGRGLVLLGNGRGGFTPMPAQQSGVAVYGEGRGAAVADYDGDGRVDLVVTQNGAPTKLYRNVGAKVGLRVRLQGPPDNPTGVGAQVRLLSGERLGPVREIHAGSGYWSQDSAVTVLGRPSEFTQLQVRWPGGKIMTVDIPRAAREVSVDQGGSVRVLKAGG